MWDKIKGVVGAAAPLLGTALGGPAGGAVAGMIAQALGVEDKPEAIEAAIASDPQALLKLKEIEAERAVELRRLVLEAEARAQAEATKQLGEINQTIRAEAAATDAYVRRWRPTYGYATALTWTLQMLGLTVIIGWAVVQHPEKAAEIIAALAGLASSLMVLWGIALAVLGASVKSRTQDKAAAAGKPPPAGLADVLAGVFGRK